MIYESKRSSYSFRTWRKRDFLSKKKALKDNKIYLDEGLSLTRVAHCKKQLPCMLEGRKEEKWEIYRGKRVL